ncbi:hypothetical protein [Tardiphaga sp. 803_E3_N1_3]|uniref:hypothetical protein n=1 Tax=Tardiphaga sp. 803_E3_N1_3 TaxID=3240785 RepID=UPI003F1EAF66
MTDTSEDFDFAPDFEDKESRLWSVNLSFWRPSELTDEEMEAFFGDRDGKWSRQTKAAMARHGAKGLDLNQSWALTVQYWSCPVCHRFKPDIFRLSNRGILLANLEEHHDHFRDYVGHRGRELFGAGWVLELPPGSSTIVDAIENLASTFSRELVCSECNAADGKAKLALNDRIPSYFSFAPTEIRGFIESAPNTDHRVDFDKVEATWRKCEPALKARVELVDQTLHMMRSGLLRRERGGPSIQQTWKHFQPQFQLYTEFLRASDRDERGAELRRSISEFLARSVQKDSNVLAPKPQAKRARAVGPTDEEYASYCDPVSSKRWQLAKEDWHCPICERTKRQIVRKSGSGRWAGGIRNLSEAIEETCEANRSARRNTLPGFTHAFIMRGPTAFELCSDCADVIPQLKARRRDIADITLTRTDIQASILSLQAHASHVVDWDEAANRAIANRSIGPSWEAYWKHRALASSIQVLHKRFLRVANETDALREITEEVMFVADIDDVEEAGALAEWLLNEAARFDAEEDRKRDEYLTAKAASTSN